jgi:hypothetical protein
LTNDKPQHGRPERALASEDERYDVAFFANKHGITRDDARDIVQRFGPSRRKCDAAAERLKSKGR